MERKIRRTQIKINLSVLVLFGLSVAFIVYCALTFPTKYIIPLPIIFLVYWTLLGVGCRITHGPHHLRLLLFFVFFQGFTVFFSVILYLAWMGVLVFLFVVDGIDLFDNYGITLLVFGLIEVFYCSFSALSSAHALELYYLRQEEHDLATKGLYIVNSPYESVIQKVTSLYPNQESTESFLG